MRPLQRWEDVCRLFRKRDPGAPLILIRAFVAIAANPDVEMSQAELGKVLGDDKPVVGPVISNCVGRLGSHGAAGGPTLYLIDVKPDPESRRTNRLRLTARGRDLAMAMRDILVGRGKNE
jgi:DNA-binding MarR family transcriptional regulator